MTARMRTINEAIATIKELDPQSAFTQTALRRMIKSGEIPSVRAGCKYLVNLDVVIEFLNSPASTSGVKSIESGKIRQIPEKIYK